MIGASKFSSCRFLSDPSLVLCVSTDFFCNFIYLRCKIRNGGLVLIGNFSDLRFNGGSVANFFLGSWLLGHSYWRICLPVMSSTDSNLSSNKENISFTLLCAFMALGNL